MGQVASPIGDFLGLGARDAQYFNPDNRLAVKMMEENMAGNSEPLEQSRRDYLSGTGDYAPGAKGIGGSSLTEREALAQDPLAGSRMAANETVNNPLLRGLYGNNSLSDRLQNEEKDLSTNGFKLNDQDRTAYGQASGDISRMYGQQENDLMSQLQSRGLASAGSGAAGAAFSGLAGNKYEQLAKMQTDLADKRYAANTARLNSTRQQIGQLGALGQQAQQAQYGRQMTGIGARRDYLNQGNNAMTGANQMNQAALQDKRNNKPQNIGDALGQGMFSGAQQYGTKVTNGSMWGQ